MRKPRKLPLIYLGFMLLLIFRLLILTYAPIIEILPNPRKNRVLTEYPRSRMNHDLHFDTMGANQLMQAGDICYVIKTKFYRDSLNYYASCNNVSGWIPAYLTKPIFFNASD